MVNNYIGIAIGIALIFKSIFRASDWDFSVRLFCTIVGINAILISAGYLLNLGYALIWPIAILGILSFIILTYGAWKMRKIPEKKFAAYVWLIGMPCLSIFAVIGYILIESGLI